MRLWGTALIEDRDRITFNLSKKTLNKVYQWEIKQENVYGGIETIGQTMYDTLTQENTSELTKQISIIQ